MSSTLQTFVALQNETDAAARSPLALQGRRQLSMPLVSDARDAAAEGHATDAAAAAAATDHAPITAGAHSKRVTLVAGPARGSEALQGDAARARALDAFFTGGGSGESATSGPHEHQSQAAEGHAQPLQEPRPPRRIAFVGNYLPRKCGIANFTHDLRCAIASRFGDQQDAATTDGEVQAPAAVTTVVCCVDDGKGPYDYGSEVAMEFSETSPASYLRAADFINSNAFDVVCVQHEFGIYGGPCGALLLDLLRTVKVPIVTTLHTILKDPSIDQRRVMNAVIALSARVVTMTPTGRELLESVYSAPPRKIAVIPHGVPDTPFSAPGASKAALDLEGHRVLLTFGLLSPNKGIEVMLRALPALTAEFPDLLYVVLGQTHPNLIRECGEQYRYKLEHIVEQLGVTRNVRFVNEFADPELLQAYIAACDVYVTPYLHAAQITSGTLANACGAGRAVVSTPFWHAVDLLQDGVGCLVPFNCSRSLARELLMLLRDPALLEHISRRAHHEARAFVWPRVAECYCAVFGDAILAHVARPRVESTSRARSWSIAGARRSQSQHNHLLPHQRSPHLDVGKRGASEDLAVVCPHRIASYRAVHLPELNLKHFLRLIDDTGIAQHSTFAIPNRNHGYCTDDCARALSTLVRLAAAGFPLCATADRAITTMLSFLAHALPSGGDGLEIGGCAGVGGGTLHRRPRFRNFMSFERLWIDGEGGSSQDAHGRAMQALGACVRFGVHVDFATWLFRRALPAALDLTAPRAIAFCLLGLCHFRERETHCRDAATAQRLLMDQLAVLFRTTASPTHRWFESALSYNNGAMAAAMIHAGAQTNDRAALDVGLVALEWLVSKQLRESDGAFIPVGSKTFLAPAAGGDARGRRVTTFDQQPIEASDMVVSCVTAFDHTRDDRWLQRAADFFDWFLGKNHIGAPLYDAATGGCHDGLHSNGVNMNQGAESTVCFVDALACLKFTVAQPLLEGQAVGTLPHH